MNSIGKKCFEDLIIEKKHPIAPNEEIVKK